MKLKAVPRLSYSKVIWAALVVFVFLTCCVVTQQADVKTNSNCRTKEDVIQNPADGICGSVNIRNSVTKLRKLENCTVIEGNVHISLIDRSSAEEFEMYSFPLLKEITGHLMLFRVRNLRSLRTLFPSLAIIRGQDLFYNYGLVAYEMQDLEEIGLINLRTIIRGGVRITKNKKLCHVDTIDWSRIAIGADPSEHHFMDNKEERRCANYCPDKCPSTVVDGVRAKRCWTSQHCQKNLNCNCNDNRPCMDNGTCCHKFCLGGCTGPLPSDCLGCKGVVFKKTCQPRCPLYTYKFFETRCLLDKECIAVRGSGSKVLKAIEQGEQNQCVTGDCPPGYMVVEEGEYRGKECVKCKDFCPKVCNSTEVNSIQDLQRLKGCSKIIGPLIIQIMGGKSVAEEMEKNLGEIREVTGFINIRRSFALLHLYFFKKLEIIGGETLAHQRHSLIVMDNANLQELFPKGHKIKIKRGQVAFHTNRRLCIYKIEEFVATLNLTDPPGDQDISQHTNGDLKVCSPEQMSLNVTQITHESALLVWEKDLKDTRHLLTYNINYKEVSTDDDDVNIYLGRDACYDEVWLNKEQQPTADNENFQMGLLPNLKPFTKYAVYVQALTLTTSTASAMTDIVTFSTSTYYPSEPLKLEVSATDDPTELHVKWKPPKYPNGLVTYYKLVYIKQPLDIKAFDRRNYCHHPLVEPKVKGKSKLEEEQKKRNMSGNCCDCLKSQKEEDKDRDKRQMEVFFENHLQNNIYCKRFDTLPREVVIDAGMTEQWHNMNKEGLAKGGRGDKLMSVMKANKNVTASLDVNLASAAAAAKEKMKYSQAYNIMELDIYNFTETVINNLEPFMEYVIELQACQDTSPSKGGLCSNSRAITSGRTKALPIKDKVNESSITVEHVTNVTGDVIISWAAPPKPNGLILKYNLKYKRASQDNLVAQDICINRQMYKELPGYRLSALEPGNWTFQILALSLTGKYSETREKYFIVDQLPGKTDNNKLFVAVAVIAFLVITLLGLLLFGAIIKYRFRSREPTVISPNINYLNSSDLIDTMDGWEKDRDKIRLLEPLGKGSFGMVYKGIATGIDNDYPDEEMWVAVKTVNDRASFFDRREFLKEATTMKAFDCYHVVKLLGVVSIGQPALVIMELMATDLKNYLREHRPDELQPGVQPPRIKDILQMAGEIADGMAYLADKKFVHRDLAARNCMVAEDATVKIGDFGMARDIYETDYYRKGGRGMLPVRWMSPESLRDGVFTSLSDVWSFGVVLWEMVTLAAQPYQGLSNEEVVKYVSDKNTMAVPEECPHEIENLMKRCWQKQRERPTFLEIIQFLEPHLNEKFRELSFYFSSGAHLSQLGDGSGDGVGESASRHDLYDKGMDRGASAYLQTDMQYPSESSLQSGMGEGNHDEDEFCSDNLMYKRDPSSHNGFDFPQNSGGHHPKHEGGKCVEGLSNDYNSRYSDGDEEDDEDDDESDSRCLMLGGGGGCPTPTTTAAEPCISSSPLSASPLLGEDANSHPHPFHHHNHHPSHETNQGLYELQPLIAPAHNSMPPVKDSTTPISTAPLSPPSSSWNPHYNKSSLPSTVAMGVTSPISNINNSDHPQQVSPPYCSPVSDYLGYNPSPSQPFSLTDTNKNSSTPHSNHQGGRRAVREDENNDRVGAGVIPQQQKEQPPLSSSSSSSSSPSSLPSSSTRGEGSDRLLWPCTESSDSSNNNSINRPSLRLPVLNQPPGGSFHQSPPNGRTANRRENSDNNKNSNGDNNLTVRSAGLGNATNASTTGPSNISDAGDGRLAENGSGRSATNSLLKDSGDNRVAPPSQTSSSLSPSSSSSLHPRQSAPSSSSPLSSQSPHPHHPHHPQSRDTSSSEGSKESTKSSTGSNSSVPIMNGYTNGHAPPPPPPPSSSSSYPALC